METSDEGALNYVLRRRITERDTDIQERIVSNNETSGGPDVIESQQQQIIDLSDTQNDGNTNSDNVQVLINYEVVQVRADSQTTPISATKKRKR